jgi:hypothetical protein
MAPEYQFEFKRLKKIPAEIGRVLDHFSLIKAESDLL